MESLLNRGNDTSTRVTGIANSFAIAKVSTTTSTGNSTHDDVVSSSLRVPCLPGTAYVVVLFGVPLNTLGDIDN
ncbi:hypothetical protein Tco_1579764, partial [Tanacetum coccineum]